MRRQMHPQMACFFHLVNPLWDVLLAVHEDHGPDFLHDYVKFDQYLTISTTFIIYHGEFAIFKNFTPLGYGCDRDLGEPRMHWPFDINIYINIIYNKLYVICHLIYHLPLKTCLKCPPTAAWNALTGHK